MSRTDKSLAAVQKKITEVEKRIKEDTSTLNELRAEYDQLQAKKITEFTKERNIDLSDGFYEMLSIVQKMASDGVSATDLSRLIESRHSSPKGENYNGTLR